MPTTPHHSALHQMLKGHFGYKAWLTFFFVVFLFSCRKEQAGVSIPQEIIAERFFNEHRINSTEEKQLIDYLSRLNEKKGFITKTVERIGFPRWDKLVKYSFLSNSSGRVATNSTVSTGGQDSATNYIIPFVRDTENHVNAAMFIKTDKGDTAISYLCDWQYTKFRTPAQISKPEDVAIFFMLFDRQVNGHKNFDVLDSALFRKDNKKAISVSFKNNDSSKTFGFSSFSCTSYTILRNKCVLPGNCNGYQGECDWCDMCIEREDFSVCDWVASVSPLGNDFGGGGTPGSGSNVGSSGNNDGPIPPSNDDGLRPGWKASQIGSGGFLKKPVLLDLDLMYSELNGQINDKNILDQYKLSFFAIEELYYEKSINPLNNDKYSRLSPEEFIELIKSDRQIALTIDPVTLLAKAGAYGAADIIVQMFFARMLDDNIQTWNEALEKVDWSQVLITMATGVLPISNKYIVAAIAGGGVILQELKNNGFTSWENLGVKFVEGFMGSLIGTGLGDLVASKFGTLSNLGRRLVTKFDGVIGYASICKWLGGGLIQINKSFNHTLGNGQVITITANKVMKGWDPQKIAVIGRSQDERVIPFANKLSNELGIHVHQIKEWQGWNSNLTIEQNKQWIQKLKNEGYTIYDIGTDPRYGNDRGPFYGMEFEEIFGN